MAEDTPDFFCSTTACDRQWLYLIGEEGLVYSQSRNRFAGLDAAGVSAYQAFDAGVSLHDLLRLTAADGASAEAALALAKIQALSQGSFPEDHSYEERADWPAIVSPVNASLRVNGIFLHFASPHKALDIFCEDCFASCPATTEPARFHLQSRPATGSQNEESWTLSINDRGLFSSLHSEQMGLGLLHAVRSLLYDEAEYDVAFHAAMVADKEHGILLCAPRESGKSTLAAYLVAHGFDLVSDEPALLNLETASISPVEMPISLKEGSWEILQREWPQLTQSPIHVRSDGCRIRLLHPPCDGSPRTPRRLTHIVFPKYSPSSPARLERLSPLYALRLLDEGGMLLGKNLGKKKFELLLKTICTVPAFIATYSSLQDAEQMIHRVFDDPDCSTRLYI